MERYKISLLPWIAVLLWMALIFCLSHQPAHQSDQLSTGIAKVIVRTLENVAPHVHIDLSGFNHIVRKNAHFFAYLLLGLLVIYALKQSGVRGNRRIGIALFLCVLYAASDETHQLFVPGRGAQVRDVVIDSAGACVGIFIYMVTEKVRMIKGRNRSRKVYVQNRDIEISSEKAE